MDQFSTPALSTSAKATSSLPSQAVCFEMKPFAMARQGSQVTFLDVWGDPPIQSVKTSANSIDNEYISAVSKSRKGSGLRATLVNWGLLLE